MFGVVTLYGAHDERDEVGGNLVKLKQWLFCKSSDIQGHQCRGGVFSCALYQVLCILIIMVGIFKNKKTKNNHKSWPFDTNQNHFMG